MWSRPGASTPAREGRTVTIASAGKREPAGEGAAAALLASPARLLAQDARASLRPMTGGMVPISREEHLARIARAQALMRAEGLAAIMIEPGASMVYFTGVEWHRSERLTAAIIPREGEPGIVTPHFEEPSGRETLKVPADVRVWNEDENPLSIVAGFLRDRRLTGKIGIEETLTE